LEIKENVLEHGHPNVVVTKCNIAEIHRQ
jgi:hypothetical protein